MLKPDHYLLGVELIDCLSTSAGPFGQLTDNLLAGDYVPGPAAMPPTPQIDGLPIGAHLRAANRLAASVGAKRILR
ncbi:hypothetical protein [Mesorhizobium sp. B1-1-8]|uniref:hypothetical protein n=1 Tax=Mesorhizobium sp. B1-1-8 TaxID=2589976 RepID=UPI0011277D30|nr:hypothetical protein [Mesorhizobium sp. B1-1-8]UCI10452.1 hypothetical protein FJ974_29520 [Mesorhizobium sp. B1-1-8]